MHICGSFSARNLNSNPKSCDGLSSDVAKYHLSLLKGKFYLPLMDDI